MLYIQHHQQIDVFVKFDISISFHQKDQGILLEADVLFLEQPSDTVRTEHTFII